MRAAWTPHTDSSRPPALFLLGALCERKFKSLNLTGILELHTIVPMSPTHHQFATFITAHRKRQGLTQPQLAHQIGVTKSNVHYWESGAGLPNPNVLEPLAQALGVSFEDLFALAGYAHPEGLPEAATYTRSKHPDYPEKAIAEAEKFYAELDDRYGKGGRNAD